MRFGHKPAPAPVVPLQTRRPPQALAPPSPVALEPVALAPEHLTVEELEPGSDAEDLSERLRSCLQAAPLEVRYELGQWFNGSTEPFSVLSEAARIVMAGAARDVWSDDE
jgi:hypothetical protein